MVTEPKTYTFEVDFLEGWQLLNAIVERRARLRLWQENGTEVLVLSRLEDRVREVTGIHKLPDKPFVGIEQYQSESR